MTRARRAWLGAAGGIVLAASAAVGATSALRVPHPDATRDSWETAAPSDCPLMAQTIAAFDFGRSGSARLLAGAVDRRPCDWSKVGFDVGVLTQPEYRAALRSAPGGGQYPEHIELSRPRYSILGGRAVVAIGHLYDLEGGDGYDCDFRRRSGVWTLQACHKTWVA